MTVCRAAPLVAAFALAAAAPALAEVGFDKITTKSEFLEVVQGKDLTLFAISVNVQPNGAIGGKAYGRSVTGKWSWNDGYFCRDLYWGKTDLGPNCQEVRVSGDVIRFQSDKGKGRYADLTMR